MNSVMNTRIVRNTHGANMVEYILLIGVVALICIAAFTKFGGKVQEKIREQGITVGGINSSPGN